MSVTARVSSFFGVLKANRPLRLFVIATALAILAAYLAIKYLELREAALLRQAQGEPQRMVRVVVASQNLKPGAVISGANMSARLVPADYVHSQALVPSQFKKVKGKRLIEPLEAGRPLLWTHIAGSTRTDFSDVIKKGRRAITVQVDQINSIDGMIEPGNEIDLYVTMPAKHVGGGNGDAIFPVVQNVTVLATGRRLDPRVQASMTVGYGGSRRERYNTVTLDVSPKQSALILAAQAAGQLSALLRNRNDAGTANFGHIKPGDIFTIARQVAIEEAAAAAPQPQIVRGPDGKPIGIVDPETGLVTDPDGNPIGRVDPETGVVTDPDGNPIGVVSEEPPTPEERVALGLPPEAAPGTPGAPGFTAGGWLVEFLAGGNSKDGVAEVQQLTVQ
ncbi:MAG TPA: Flp pilus assembly protein CpaB [Gammaproteobacteria bacterium]|nr:Flp pilus assembly protein CpaB [Gammaproteobacteria bacterium]